VLDSDLARALRKPSAIERHIINPCVCWIPKEIADVLATAAPVTVGVGGRYLQRLLTLAIYGLNPFTRESRTVIQFG